MIALAGLAAFSDSSNVDPDDPIKTSGLHLLEPSEDLPVNGDTSITVMPAPQFEPAVLRGN